MCFVFVSRHYHKTIRTIAVSMNFHLDLMRTMGFLALQCTWLVRNLLPIRFGHTVDVHASNHRPDPIRLPVALRFRTLECFLHFSLRNLNKKKMFLFVFYQFNTISADGNMVMLTVKWIQCFACAKRLQRLCLIVHFFVLLFVGTALTRARQ